MDPDDGVFDICDFTVATEWEKFIANAETLLNEHFAVPHKRQCKLPASASELTNWRWVHEPMQTLHYAAKRFALQRHTFVPVTAGKADDASAVEPLRDVTHPSLQLESNNRICSYFGVADYILMTPVTYTDSVTTESKRQQVLGALHVALQQTKNTLPIVVQYGDATRHVFYGVGTSPTLTSHLTSLHLRRCPSHCQHLTGLLDMFRERVGCLAPPSTLPPVRVTVRLSYQVEIGDDVLPTVSISTIDDESNSLIDLPSQQLLSSLLPFGVDGDPLKSVRLLCTWHNVVEDLVVENGVYTDLTPSTAPYWAMSVAFDAGHKALMHESVGSIVGLTRSRTTFSTVLGDSLDPVMPISELDCARLIDMIFNGDDTEGDNKKSSFKACSPTSPAYRLSICLTVLLSADRGLVRFTQIWLAFVARLRQYWEEVEYVPSLPRDEQPNHNDCFIQQKLTMLQCCIHSKLTRDKLTIPPSSSSKSMSRSSEDVFYDADDTPSYVNDSTKSINVPVTQDMGPMTEDMLHSTIDGSAALLSDMQAFKDANPDCEFADFVRWHSPKDYVDGRLSERMTGGQWQTCWQQAKAVPVTRQARLFNDSKCAEQILHWLESMSVATVAHHLLPIVLVAAVNQLGHEEGVDLVKGKLAELVEKTKTVTGEQRQSPDNYRAVLKDIAFVENAVAQYRSLLGHLHAANESRTITDDKLTTMARALMTAHVPLHGGNQCAQRSLVDSLFGSGEYGSAVQKEYTLTWQCSSPAASSRSCPQRMYTCVNEKAFRCAITLTHDATFM